MAKALFIIAFRDYQDWEYGKTKEILEKTGIECDTASTQKGIAKGAFGQETKVSKILEEIKEKDYDLVIYIGGAGTPSVRKKTEAVKIAKEFFDAGKLCCAICWASTILAKAGILKNKKATVWLGQDPEYRKTTDKVLEQYGCDFVNKDVVTDGKIITANGPPSAEKFAQEILKQQKRFKY